MTDFLSMALHASDLSEKVILDYFDAGVSVEWKPDNTPVTKADKNAEDVMRTFFAKETPHFGIIGEEFGVENQAAEYQWIIDPIDGTKSFIHGVPLFGTLIALYHKNEPLASVINLPALKTKVYASQGGGAFVKNNKGNLKVNASAVDKIEDSLVLSGTINTIESTGYGEKFKKLRQEARLYRGFGDCYGYYLVATGRAEIMVDPVVSLWDIAPMPLLFQESCGKFSTFSGSFELFDANGKPLESIYEGFTGVASNGNLHTKVLEYLA